MEYRGFTLDAFQETAIRHLQDDRSVLVAAPTGTGKTIIADWIVEDALAANKRVIYTAPIKALSNQKFRDYTRLHGEQNVGLVTGDLVIRRDAPCLVMTTEILRNMLLGGERLDDLRAVVIDEVHFLDDRERGTVWEEVLIYLPQHVLIVALSATLPNLDEFSEWLTSVRERPVEVVIEQRRTVPLDYHFAVVGHDLMDLDAYEQAARRHKASQVSERGDRGRDRKGRDRKDHRGRRGEGRTHPIDVFKLVRRADWLPMLYFVFSRHDAERFGRTLAFRFRAQLLDSHEVALVDEHLDKADLGPALDDELRDMYRMGIAFHHAGLHVSLKAVVEELYEARLIKALFCTSTFALGINMPARTVVFHGLEKYDGQAVRPLPTRGFMQKAGRAGRRGMDEAGHVVIRMDFEDWPPLRPMVDRYRKQLYEPVRSSFSLSWNSIVNLLERLSLDAIRVVVGKSFLSWNLANAAKDQLRKADALEARASQHAGGKKELKEARRLRKRAETAHERPWQEFLEKREFLRSIGYLDPDDTFLAGAKVLRHLQIAEIFVTELVLSGLLEDLDPATLFGVLCALTNDTPRNVVVHARPTRADRELATAIDRVRMSPPVVGGERISKQPVTWCPDLMLLGRSWAQGQSLEQILTQISSPTDWSGTLITGFRRAKDLAGQLRDVYAEVPDRQLVLRQLVNTVSRDEVEVVD